MATTSTIAAVVANNNRPRTPSGFPHPRTLAPLVLPSDEHNDDNDDDEFTRLRRHSTSIHDEDELPQSPVLSALDSSAALILVHDDSDDSNEPFDFSDDEEAGDEDDIVTPVFEIRRTSIPPLRPLSIFLYLLSPYLKLGALNILTSTQSVKLKHSLPALFAFAIMSAFSRQLWYRLARYMRKADLMEVVCDTFAKARGRERPRRVIRSSVKVGTAVVNAFLAIVYLHESANYLLPLLPDTILSRIGFGVVFGGITLYLSTAQTLASKRVMTASWLSVLTYTVWFACAIYSHAKGILPQKGGWLSHPPSFWQGIFTIAFTFTTSSTLPIYASLKSGTNPLSTAKTPRSRSFRVLSLSAASLATALVLPLVIFAASPNPASRGQDPLSIIPKPTPTPEGIHIALSILSSMTLLLGVPQAIISVPPLPLRIGRTASASRTIPSLIILASALLLSFSLHSKWVERHVFTALDVAVIVLALASTYFLPAFLHVWVHFFKRPLAIVAPRTPLLQTSSNGDNNGASGSGGRERSTGPDELLQRKERALQKKQFRKRIVWDVGAWVQIWACALGVVVGFSLLRQ